MPSKYPLKPDGFTTEGFNDRPKPCPEKHHWFFRCKGMVEPTRNANIGKCNVCGEKVSWGNFL